MRARNVPTKNFKSLTLIDAEIVLKFFQIDIHQIFHILLMFNSLQQHMPNSLRL